MDQDFIRKKITELRVRKGISEYKLSMDLGHNKSYIAHISAGRTLPSLLELLYICDYFEISPSHFFDDSASHSLLAEQAYTMMKDLDDDDLLTLISLIQRLKSKNETKAV